MKKVSNVFVPDRRKDYSITFLCKNIILHVEKEK